MLLVLALLGWVPSCLHVRAQAVSHDEPPPVDEQLVLDVVRLTAHEAGLDSLGDADGIYAVLVNGAAARGLGTHAFARTHSPRFFRGTSARPWALALTLDCARPRGFTASWDLPRGERLSRHDACVALVEHVRAIVAAPPICRAETWGSLEHDYARLRARGVCFVMDDCGSGALNGFSHGCAR